ncbi:conserved hypothetical protein [Vibrio coralliirubri]|uniref:hypothetical protein n=1 Tax=Vibrio coralliirubri TaxID=1516159 RepID=UPI00062F0C3A|nr:hypothetical protein [Vibrio coralliirubri]CDT85712.1 conserved hypothetical protein [Vibrio coralliirubri]
MSSIIIDTCVLTHYQNPMDPNYKKLFSWVNDKGVLYVTQKLLNEYYGTGNQGIAVLLAELVKDADNIRLVKVKKNVIEGFTQDKRYNYTANIEDQYHAKLTFVSPRKKLISRDNKLINDVNGFSKVDKIQPEAIKVPDPDFYE